MGRQKDRDRAVKMRLIKFLHSFRASLWPFSQKLNTIGKRRKAKGRISNKTIIIIANITKLGFYQASKKDDLPSFSRLPIQAKIPYFQFSATRKNANNQVNWREKSANRPMNRMIFLSHHKKQLSWRGNETRLYILS